MIRPVLENHWTALRQGFARSTVRNPAEAQRLSAEMSVIEPLIRLAVGILECRTNSWRLIL